MKTIRLDGVVGYEITAANIASQIEGEKSLKLIINSGGGDILEGFSIYNLLADFEGSIEVQIDFAASMASVIAMVGDKVSMKESSSVLMIHRPWGVMGGNSEELRAHADVLDKLEVLLMNLYLKKTGMDEAELNQMLADETYFTASEALSFGFIDQIDKGKADAAAVALVALNTTEKYGLDSVKFAAKLNESRGDKPPTKELFANADTLSDVESVMRKNLNLSQSEATAIVAAVKKTGRGDHDQQSLVDTFQSFQFKNI